MVGIRRGWGGLVDVIHEKESDNSNNYQELTEEIVDSRRSNGRNIPSHLADQSQQNEKGGCAGSSAGQIQSGAE